LPPGAASKKCREEQGDPKQHRGYCVGGSLGSLALIVGAVVAVVYMLGHRWAKKPESAHTYLKQPAYDTSSADSAKVKYPSGGWGPAELAPERPVAELPARHLQSWRN
jgi:hypothetical protein